MMLDEVRRANLEATVHENQRELNAALGELREAVERPFAIAERCASQIAQRPLASLLAALAVGVWLGRR